jgi:hypothetical protein
MLNILVFDSFENIWSRTGILKTNFNKDMKKNLFPVPYSNILYYRTVKKQYFIAKTLFSSLIISAIPGSR